MTSPTLMRETNAPSGLVVRFARSAMAILLAVALATPAAAARLHGRVKQGVYHSPAKNFTVPVPKGMRISDDFRKDVMAGAVSFHSVWGSLSSIHYANIPMEAQAMFAEPGRTEALLVAWLSNYAMPAWFLHASPQSRVIRQSPASFEGHSVLVAAVEIPGSHHAAWVRDASGALRQSDSIRGLVIFNHGAYVYMLATEIGNQATDDAWMQFVESLKPFYQSILFTI